MVVIAAVVAMLVFGVGIAVAGGNPGAVAEAGGSLRSSQLGGLDVRSDALEDVPADVRAARSALKARLGEGGFVSAEPADGGLRIAGSTSHLLTAPEEGDPAQIALAYVRSHLDLFGLDESDLEGLLLDARYTSPDGVTHLTWQQTVDGIPSYDTYLFANVDAEGGIVNVGGSPVSGLSLDNADPGLGPTAALAAAAEDVGGSAGRQLAPAQGSDRAARFAGGDTASLVVLADPAGDRLGWRVVVDGEEGTFEEVVDADTGAPLVRHSLNEDASSASVFQYYPGAPAGGTAESVNLAADPSWLDNTSSNTRLWGNNAQAYSDLNNNNGDDAGEDVPASSGTDWLYPQAPVASATGHCALVPNGCTWDPATSSSKETNRKQVTTQAFYFVNNYHDWLLQPPIGFDEASHNFERVNSSAAPGAGDPLLTEADDGNGTGENINNANMATPADGSSPRMQMYFFFLASNPEFPAVNGADDASVVYHEYTHGLSNRLVQNGVGNALQATQSGAMGEGWSDWYAMDYLVAHGLQPDSASPDVVLGRYATGNTTRGIRNEPLDCPVSLASAPCAGTETAPSGGFTFADLGRVTRLAAGVPRFEVHADGEIWSQTLWDLRQTLGPTTARGLITGGMRLAPDDPGMLEMRDAILQADLATGGTHHDQIWEVFANRGMGFRATSLSPSSTHGVASFSTPPLAAAAAPVPTDPAPLGDGDGAAEPGEAVRLNVQLSNPDTTPLTTVKATLSSGTPGIVVGQPTASYGTIGAGGVATNSTPFAVSLPAATACSARVGLTLQVSSDQGSVSVPLEDLTLGSGTQTFTNSTPTPIPDNDPTTGVSSTITVAGLPAGTTASHLHVGLDINHTWVGDIRAELTHGATSVSLVDQPGLGESSAGSDANNLSAVDLFDTAPSSIQAVPFANTTPARTGPQRPNEPLARFDGADPSGVWTLKLNDVELGDTGTLNSWSVTVPKPACSTTAPPLPEAVTGAASALTSSAAHVAGQVDPKGAATEFAVQYGPTGAYGSTTAPASAGSASGLAAVGADLSGLSPSSEYHYRVVALRAGTVIALGADQTLHTAAVVNPGGNEIVTPGGGSGGGSNPSPTPAPTPTPAPKPKLKCKKGFKKKTVHGKARCVKVKRKHHRH
ncbi:MAG TPA: M36 family metallopeptidase [Solirubrobacterales bacterium]|jgi:subtilisin-like proprotein convertase family protein|nr:M36 family metallopeptidase [Solirubrobacterales bacterium]